MSNEQQDPQSIDVQPGAGEVVTIVVPDPLTPAMKRATDWRFLDHGTVPSNSPIHLTYRVTANDTPIRVHPDYPVEARSVGGVALSGVTLVGVVVASTDLVWATTPDGEHEYVDTVCGVPVLTPTEEDFQPERVDDTGNWHRIWVQARSVHFDFPRGS